MAKRSKIKVGVVERNRLLRERLTAIIRSQRDMIVAFSTSTIDHQSSMADVILLQQEIPDSSLQIQKTSSEDNSKLLLVNADQGQQGFAHLLRCGARGFILTDSTEADVIDAIRIISGGGWAIPERILSIICSEIAYAEKNEKSVLLTNRECQIARLVSDNLTNKEIAGELNIGLGTVKTHIHQILKKLDLQKRVQLSKYLHKDQESHQGFAAHNALSNELGNG